MIDRSEFRKSFAALDALGSEADKNGLGDVKRRRGCAFESLVSDLFDKEEILIRRPYHTSDNSSEQIDGAIQIGERVALVEVKWVESGLAASELYAFLGKIQGKLDGTLGVFISREKLSQNFLASARSGRRPCVLLIHGEDVSRLFDDGYSLKDYLQKYIHALSIDNCVTYSFEDYYAERTDKGHVEPKYSSKTEQVLSQCFEDPVLEHALKIDIQDWSSELIRKLFLDFVKLLPRVYRKAKQKNDKMPFKNALVVLRLCLDNGDVDVGFVLERVQRSFQEPSFQELMPLVAPYYKSIQVDKRKEFEDALVAEWKQAFGNFDAENSVALITEPLFWSLGEDSQDCLIDFLVEIQSSSIRYDKFPQKSLAKEILSKDNGKDIAMRRLKAQIAEALSTLVNSPLADVYDDLDEYAADALRLQFKDYSRILGGDRYDKVILEASDQAKY